MTLIDVLLLLLIAVTTLGFGLMFIMIPQECIGAKEAGITG